MEQSLASGDGKNALCIESKELFILITVLKLAYNSGNLCGLFPNTKNEMTVIAVEQYTYQFSCDHDLKMNVHATVTEGGGCFNLNIPFPLMTPVGFGTDSCPVKGSHGKYKGNDKNGYLYLL